MSLDYGRETDEDIEFLVAEVLPNPGPRTFIKDSIQVRETHCRAWRPVTWHRGIREGMSWPAFAERFCPNFFRDPKACAREAQNLNAMLRGQVQFFGITRTDSGHTNFIGVLSRTIKQWGVMLPDTVIDRWEELYVLAYVRRDLKPIKIPDPAEIIYSDVKRRMEHRFQMK